MVANQGNQRVGCHIFTSGSRNSFAGFFSVDGQWIVTKKDWREAKKRAKFRERRNKSKERRGKEKDRFTQESNTTDSAAEETSEPDYTPDMDEQRCILYFHGGKL